MQLRGTFMKIGKKIFFILCVFFIGQAVFSAAFTGFSGIKGDYFSDSSSESFDPQLEISAFFSGQLDISPQFLIRTELSLKTNDIIETKLFEETESYFCVDELSLTYIKPFLGITQYVSLFLGNFEPIGSDVFLQRQFGILPITSLLTESWLGLRGSTVYPFYGVGGSYIIHLNNKPYATGLSIYGNKNNEKEINQLNVDFRFATVHQFLTVDLSAGFGAPLNQKNGTEDVILLIDELYLHAGIDFLLGNNFSQALFIQAGFENFPVRTKNSQIYSNEIYLLFEPRLYTKNFRAHLTFFSLPAQTVQKLSFIEENHTLGLNLSIFTDKLYVKNRDFTFGFHTTLSFADSDFFDLQRILELQEKEYCLKVSPFLTVPVMGGELKSMLQVKLNDFTGERWQDHFKFSLGYKSQI